MHATLPGWKKKILGEPVLCEDVYALEKVTPREDYPRGVPLRSLFLDHQGTWVKMNVLTS